MMKKFKDQFKISDCFGVKYVQLFVGFLLSCMLVLFFSDVAFAGGGANSGAAANPATIGPDLSTLGACGGGSTTSIGQAICNFGESFQTVPGMASGVSYLLGIIFALTGIFKIREHVESPNQTPIWDAVKRFLAGGLLFSLPLLINVLSNSLFTDPDFSYGYTGFNGSVSGGGLDTIVVALVRDLWQPVHLLLSAFAYLAGLVFLVMGILRLLKSAQDGPRGPGGIGTIMTFVAASALFSLDSLMGAFSNSLFGNPVTATEATLSYVEATGGLSGNEQAHITAVISAVIGFVALLGWVSFIRGWFILRSVAEGDNQASMMAALTHIIGGAVAVNLGPFLNAVQVTFGLTGVGVAFG